MVFGADGFSDREDRKESEAPLRCAVGLPISHPRRASPEKKARKAQQSVNNALVSPCVPGVARRS